MSSTRASGKNLRCFTWSDIQAFSGLLNALGRHGFRRWPESAEALATELRAMRLRPERDIFLLEDGSHLCGYSLALPEPDIGRAVAGLGVLPDCASMAGTLLDAVMGSVRSRHLPAIHVAVRHGSADPVQLYLQRGFCQIASVLEMALDRAGAKSLQDEPLPEGFSIRPMASSGEVRLLTDVQNAVFAGHWGFSANTPEEVLARLQIPGAGPENVLFAESGDGEVAAYVWTSLYWDHGHTCGRILMTGVMPDYRQSGLGRAAMQAGIKRLFAAGAADIHLEVMSDNEPAVSLYQAAGFEPDGRVTWYELRPG